MTKVAIVGSFNTGKTTLFGNIQSSFRNATYVQEIARELGAEGSIRLNERATYDDQLKLLCNQITQEMYAEQKNDLTIVDGGTLVQWAYVRDILRRDMSSTPYSEHKYSLLFKEINAWNHTYDVAYYLPLCDVAFCSPDGVRSIDMDARARIDKDIIGTLDSHENEDCLVVKLPNESCDKQAYEMSKHLREYLYG